MYSEESIGETGRLRNGNPKFYEMLEEMAETHDIKSHDYASNSNPSGNYHFAGQVSSLFSHSPQDAGFAGRIAEKIYRLANLEGSGKDPKNETIADTERDIAVITVLWMTDRRDRRNRLNRSTDGGTKEAGVREIIGLGPYPASSIPDQTDDTKTFELLRNIGNLINNFLMSPSTNGPTKGAGRLV